MTALFEVFYQPGKLFAGLSERKYAWIVPIIAVGLLGFVGIFMANHYIGVETMARQNMQMYASRMSPEQMQQAIAAATSPARIMTTYIIAPFGVALTMVVIAGALMAFSMMTKTPPRFGTMLAMVCIAFFPLSLVTTLMSALTLALSPDPTSLDIRNLLATNVAAFMNKNETSPAIYSVMTSLDVLSFAEIFLLALGFAKICKSKIGGGLGAVLTLWVLYVFAKMGISAAFGV
jgi:hypothetical protein